MNPEDCRRQCGPTGPAVEGASRTSLTFAGSELVCAARRQTGAGRDRSGGAPDSRRPIFIGVFLRVGLPNRWCDVQVRRNAGTAGYRHLYQSAGITHSR
jgi:hypothetical protein